MQEQDSSSFQKCQIHEAIILLISNVLTKFWLYNGVRHLKLLTCIYSIFGRYCRIWGCSCSAHEASCVTVFCSTVYPEWGGEWRAQLKAFAVQLISVNPSNCMLTSMFLLSMQAIVYGNEAKHESMCYSENSKRCPQTAKRGQENSWSREKSQPKQNPPVYINVLIFKKCLKMELWYFYWEGWKNLMYKNAVKSSEQYRFQ